MKKILILNQDGLGLFDAPPQNISAKIERVTVGAVHTDFYKLTANNGEFDFLVGIFDSKQGAEKNLKSLRKTLKKARHDKFKYNGWEPTREEVSALELLEELNDSAYHKDFIQNIAERILNGDIDDDEIPF